MQVNHFVEADCAEHVIAEQGFPFGFARFQVHAYHGFCYAVEDCIVFSDILYCFVKIVLFCQDKQMVALS